MKHIARKRFGQHFLSDQSVIAAIVDAINPQPAQPMVEIGPGLAALTQPLVERLGHLTVIELDRDLAARLRTRARIAELQREKEADTEDRETEINGEPCTVVENADIMRLQLMFDGKPDEETRSKLKANGFRWSPKNGAWQRQLTENARRALRAMEGGR